MSERHETFRANDEGAGGHALQTGARIARGRSARRRRPASPHSHRFLAVTASLVGIALAAIVVAVAVLLGGSHRRAASQPWSSWSPPNGGLAGEREIADEVAPFYRASSAYQLVAITVQNISDSSSTNTQLAYRDPSSGSLDSIAGNSAVYNLCGLGPNCAIATGTPSSARLLLLRREALELALYTFKYISGVDNVVALLPPGKTTTTGTLTPNPPAPGKTQSTTVINLAIAFQRQSLQPYLEQPLSHTLPEPIPPTVAEMPNAPEAELVSVLTGQALFQQQLVQAQDGTSLLVLNPLPPQ